MKYDEYTKQVLETITDESFEKEREWELQMQERGKQRFVRNLSSARQRQAESTTSYGLSLVKHSMEGMTKRVAEWMDKFRSGKALAGAKAIRQILGLDPEIVAFISLRSIIDRISLHDHQPVQSIAVKIGGELMLEVKLRKFAEIDPERWQTTKYYLEHSQGRRYKSTVYQYAISKSTHFNFEPWPESDRLIIGMQIIGLIIDETGLFFIDRGCSKGIRKGYLELHPTPKVVNWIQHHCEHSEIMNPDYYPTLIPPKPWAEVNEGGYWFNHPDLMLPLIKTWDKEYLAMVDNLLQNGHIDEVKDCVNHLQCTAWKINDPILEIAQTLWDNGGDTAGLPPLDLHHLPPCPVCGADITESANAGLKHECLDLCDEDTKKAWKRDAKTIRTLNACETSKRLAVARTLQLAQTMKRHEQFYFPYQLDFRGRIYAIPAFLNPQGTDLAKSLLMFAKGKPLGSKEAVRWLGIHTSNCYGNDKVSLDDRYQWTLDNSDKIRMAVEDPYTNNWWMDADEPFCFLAACYEWVGYLNEGLEFVSHLPIAMDGTCNGLQLLSLMLRDEIGGSAVNLIPSDKPNDIYNVVAEKVIAKLKKMAKDKSKVGTDDDESWKAEALLQLPIDRKTTKRQVMVMPYGGTHQSCVEYTKKWMKEHGHWSDPKEFNALALCLARIIWDAIGATVVKAREAMNYLHQVAAAVIKTGNPIYWRTPSGLIIKQAYRKYQGKRIKTMIGDQIYKVSLGELTDNLDRHKGVNAISPNFVHSFDASALMRTVCKCRRQGIDSFAMIHDSYGTHASDAPRLATLLRESFVEIFDDHDVLGTFEDDLLKRTTGLEKDQLPERPKFGSLNVDEVKNSMFFFA